MSSYIRPGDPWFFCTACGARRTRAKADCTCEPFKAEFELSDDIARIMTNRILAQIEQLCKEVQSMGWGYRLVVQSSRDFQPDAFNKRVCYTLRHTILLPGQDVPPGEWTVYSPWLVKDKED